MKYRLSSEYIIEPKEENLTNSMRLKTTKEVQNIMLTIAKENGISTNTLLNNAILQFLVNNVEKNKDNKPKPRIIVVRSAPRS